MDFKYKKDLDFLKKSDARPLHLGQGLCFGAVYLLHELAQRLSIVAALVSERQEKLALWQGR